MIAAGAASYVYNVYTYVQCYIIMVVVVHVNKCDGRCRVFVKLETTLNGVSRDKSLNYRRRKTSGSHARPRPPYRVCSDRA